ncbi:precorrin-6y C5,15-methyltransferase (decarboxylating) subunit CbiE [Fundidesulfovibrio terrae]|uniref:precorrin-6y C5,15-methyltransferase (decarboxylating) subunit CbiE n=1 Tax=Fundidesulfovibrio terrae TaxID=2922866 RepID=UPI001FAEA628|nr:precorrin-6y C5,15-methyltransferase (decarboxylating) subunit CbiE [Fundidesulfovibrio terrae]
MGGDALNGGAKAIEVVGLGMGGGLARSEMERIVTADVLAGGARLLERFTHLRGERVVLGSPLETALTRISRAFEHGLRVVVLADGDPLYFGIGARLIERFGRERLRFHPGVCAVQAACARIGLPWQDLPAVSLHGRSDPGPLFSALAAKSRAAVYTDNENTPDAVARLLLERGIEDATVWVLEDLGSPDERARRFSPQEASGESFSALNLVVIEGAQAPAGPPVLGRPDEFYQRQDGLITKWPARAASLAALRLPAGGVLWDVGAGCGAVGIEACALMPGGRVFAVERDPERHQAVKANIRACGAWQVKAVKGEAPEAFSILPDPDRVFVGGSLGKGTTALAEACRRLAPGGRVVVNTVLLGSLQAALEHFRQLGWGAETCQVQASLAAPLAGDQRLAALNPVFIVAADKPA